jgi:hypothetical protein
MTDKNEWGSNMSFILAMIGSAVGLGNIWRYPYVLYSNGGGAFYIPYIVAILLMGIPFLILEYGVGYNFKSSFAKAVKTINSKWELEQYLCRQVSEGNKKVSVHLSGSFPGLDTLQRLIRDIFQRNPQVFTGITSYESTYYEKLKFAEIRFQ